jgi:hypothetical protein
MTELVDLVVCKYNGSVIDPDRRIEKIRSHIGMVFQSC